MRSRTRILMLILAGAVVLVFALIVLLDGPSSPSPSSPTTTDPSAAAAEHASSSGFDGALLPGTVDAPAFTLTDQHGRRVSLGRYRGRVVILTFLASACAPTCPLVAQQIRGALDELGRAGGHPIPTLIVSADASETPAAARRFLDRAALSGRVEYLTGSPAELRRVWRAYNIVPAQLADANSPHAAAVLLIDRLGQERDLFQVEQLTPETLAHDVRKVETER